MPIIIPDGLPITQRLESEGISVIGRHKAERQDIRPQEIALLNLMPNKQRTEKQIARLLGDTPLQVGLTLLRTQTYTSKNESEEHLGSFYHGWEEVAARKFDGLIVTGAPVEEREFEDVDYWKELQKIMDWSRENVYASLFICWGAQAALKHQYGIEKHMLPEKAFGVFSHKANDMNHPLSKGFDDEFFVPVSRNTEVRRRDIENIPDLKIVAESQETGLYLIQSSDGRRTYCFNHPEYGAMTIKKEYERDAAKGIIPLPTNYFPHNDINRCPTNRWRSHARVLYGNWLNNNVYQQTPFDLQHIHEKIPV